MQYTSPVRHSLWLWAGALLLIALAVLPRVLFLARWPENFDGDEALLALYGRRAFSTPFQLFLPGQSYMGTLPCLVAGLLQKVFTSHAAVARLAPLLWVIPGWLALRGLDRLGRQPLTRGWGDGLLAVLWFLPPAALFFAGVKLRGGMLESLVLGLWAMFLLWPRDDARTPARAGLLGLTGGLLYGLALWTHEQMLLLAPCFLLVSVLPRVRRGWRLFAALIGLALGYLPLWLPRLAAGGLGPPAVNDAGWVADWAQVPRLGWILRIPSVWREALTAGSTSSGVGALPGYLHAVLVGVGCIVALALWLRPSQGALRRSPVVVVVSWLALANVGAAILARAHETDPYWHRYLICLTPFMVYGMAWALRRMPQRWAWTGAALLALLSLYSYRDAHPGWESPADPYRTPLVAELERTGADRVLTEWSLAYFVSFVSGERIVCSSYAPPRFPEDNALVDFAPEAWHCAVRSLRQRVAPGGVAPDEKNAVIRRRESDPSPELAAAFASLPLRRTLFAHYEPWPLLAPSAYRRDWRGWPYRRPLSRFDAIVWQPQRAMAPPVAPASVDAILRGLVDRGEFEVVAEGSGQRILRRPGR